MIEFNGAEIEKSLHQINARIKNTQHELMQVMGFNSHMKEFYKGTTYALALAPPETA